MAKKVMAWRTKGMNRDLSVSAFSPEFAFENVNLRLSTNESNTQMSWVSERGTLPLTLIFDNGEDNPTEETKLTGTVIGTAVLNNQLILFTKGTKGTNTDCIYRLKYLDDNKTTMLCKTLYVGNLDFEKDGVTSLETLASYESELVQKVYWVDGVHQPRVININRDYDYGYPTAFDFVRTLDLKENVTVQKLLGASGMFAPGVIQYAFTYYDQYLQETNIFYTTPLCYISYPDRGAAPDQKVENAFKITVTGLDSHFDYLRIYSIQRTSLDGTPICKRVQDIYIKGIEGGSVSYVDTGYNGDTIDPTELLYKGGEVITASTIEQKDNTLFLGNIKSLSAMNESTLDSIVSVENLTTKTRSFYVQGNACAYSYGSQLSAYSSNDYTEAVPCGGFKGGDYYRLGLQFQYKTGKWSKPVYLKDFQVSASHPSFSESDNEITVPIIEGKLSGEACLTLRNMDYKKARAVVVFPQMQDRVTICQGVVNPTLYTTNHRETDKDLYAQSSWFFRPHSGSLVSLVDTNTGAVYPENISSLVYSAKGLSGYLVGASDNTTLTATEDIRRVEIQGYYDPGNRFQIDHNFVTFHSPDVEFDSELSALSFSNTKYSCVGSVSFTKTFSDIDIQTETPTISNSGAGFIHKSYTMGSAHGIVSGLFYEDYIVDDNNKELEKYSKEKKPYKWMAYLWHRKGSLNNDISRPADKGNRTAMLKKKVISNLRYTTTTFNESARSLSGNNAPQLFSSDEVTILKSGNNVYQGNVSAALVPDEMDGMFFMLEGKTSKGTSAETGTTVIIQKKDVVWKTHKTVDSENKDNGYYYYAPHDGKADWDSTPVTSDIGDQYVELVMDKTSVPMKYKSTPHLIFDITDDNVSTFKNGLPILEITQTVDTNTIFGGQSADALQANTWVPCGKPVALSTAGTTVSWEYGDTYFQRWDCLKTYPFTRDDVNQVVEIGSFMLETRVNIDGRYDRNRGQLSNLNMSPTNFNLMNMVYSQVDNFFSYKIMPDDAYENDSYPNQITWNLTKESGADVDLWTKINLASVLEMDGDKGKVNKLIKLGNQIFCFQDTGISQVLYNESVQVSSTEGVPVEIANSGKVQGKRYISNVIGCTNKKSVAITPSGAYFIDNTDKSIYLFTGGELKNISASAGFNVWCKTNIPSSDVKQTGEDLVDFASFYDKLNQEVLFVNKDTALAWNEKFNLFTSFYSYGNAPFFNTLLDTGVWIKGNALWKHQAGSICKFFGVHKPYSMTLIGNPEPTLDKIFTNLEFRANAIGEGEVVALGPDVFDDTFDTTFHPEGWGKSYIFKFFTPFDSIEVWNEHQRGSATFDHKNGRETMRHFLDDNTSHLARKMRIWRCDIPRNNYPLPETDEEKAAEQSLGIYRYYRKPMDRMRNPWLYLKLTKNAISEEEIDETKVLPKVEIHDLMMTYYD